jgi:hypothetical protein
MAAYEYPYLDRPAGLEYPNETWAAQDVRKAEIFATVADYVAGADRERMLERSCFFFERSIATLTDSASRTLARPVVILLTNGHNMATLQRAEYSRSHETPVTAFDPPATFVPQKARAKRNAMLLAASAAVLVAVAILYVVAIAIG